MARSGQSTELNGLLGYQLRRASAMVMADLAVRLETLDLTPGSASMLLVISAKPGITQSEIGRILSIKRANMVPMAANLQTRGLLSRKRVDGRSHGLKLTGEGEALVTRIRRQIKANEKEFASRLEAGQLGKLLAGLAAMWQQ